MTLILAFLSLVFAAIPAVMFFANLPLFSQRNDLDETCETLGSVSVLIPARDEESGILASIQAALANELATTGDAELEVVVLDDHSTDSTAAIVQEIQSNDGRVRYLAGAELPPSWNGKQHACKQLADAAKHHWFVFLDADVRLEPTAIQQMLQRQTRDQVALLSAFPRQETGTFLEKLLIPMMHFILLGFLPFARMRGSTHPAYAAGCGQLFVTSRDNYYRSGTHAAIHDSRHDGLKLPKIYRQSGLSTDVIDGTNLATCRMYTSGSQVVRGVLKNANEGIATAKLILPFTLLLIGGSVLPIAVLVIATVVESKLAIIISILAILIGHAPRAIAAIRFRQSWIGVAGHGLATLLFVALQWTAFAMNLLGKKVTWRGRN
ncbi:MAG: glycosyltransferase [Pirellulaceae bacterium]|nr:glycosyltransferase [Pirellulaceae bacterium]